MDDSSTEWKDQKCILFDDSFRHSVIHTGKGRKRDVRIILMVDLWHYNLDNSEKSAICKLFPPQ